jgi:hypothetical protein
MVTPRFRWFAMALAAALFSGLLAAPYHASEEALRAAPGWLFALDRAAWSSRALQLGLHLAAVWLAAGWYGALLPAQAARAALLLYAIHPAQTQAIASLEGRPLLAAAVLSLAALRCWRGGHLWPAASFGALAALGHWSALALGPLLWLWSAREQRREAAAPLGVISGVGLASAIHALGQAQGAAWPALEGLGLALLRGLGQTALPAGLSAYPSMRFAAGPAAAGWCGLAALLAWLAWKRPGPWRWAVAGLITLAPAAGAAAPALALVFLCGAAGWLAAGADRRLLQTAAALFAVVTLLQVEMWRSERRVWLEAARLAPLEAGPRLRLAPLVDARHALELLEEARRLAPGDPRTGFALAEAYRRAGRPAAAEVELERARRACDGPCASGPAR